MEIFVTYMICKVKYTTAGMSIRGLSLQVMPERDRYKQSSKYVFAKVPDARLSGQVRKATPDGQEKQSDCEARPRAPILVDSKGFFADKLPVSAYKYNSQVLIHPSHPQCPLLRHCGKVWAPLVTIRWGSDRGELTLAQQRSENISSSEVVAAFLRGEMKGSEPAILLAVALLPISQELGTRLVLRLVKLKAPSVRNVSPISLLKAFVLKRKVSGMPDSSSGFVRSLATVSSCVVGSVVVDRQDKSAMAMMRLMGYSVQGKGGISVVPCRSEKEFEKWMKANAANSSIESEGPDIFSALTRLQRQLKVLNSRFHGESVFSVANVPESSEHPPPQDCKTQAGLEMDGIAYSRDESITPRKESMQSAITWTSPTELGTIPEVEEEE